MIEFIMNNAGAIWSILCSAIAVTTSVLAFFARRSGNTKILETTNKIIRLLPSMITFAETVNPGRTGEEKKAFVLQQISQMTATMNIDFDEDTIKTISDNIDAIVKATKQMHTGVKRDESHIGNVLN